MSGRTSLKHSVLYFSWMLVILAGILPTGYLVHHLSRACVADTQRLAMRDLALVYQLLIEHGPFGSVEELHDWSLKIAGQLGVRITYIAEDGRAIADSDVAPDRISDMENFAGRPEIVQAQQGGTGVSIHHSKAMRKEMVFAARKASLPSPLFSCILRLSADPPEIKRQLERLLIVLPVYLFLLFVGIALAAPLVLRPLGRAVSRLEEAVESLGSGKPVKRLHLEPAHELYSLAQSLHQAGERLENRFASLHEERRRLEAVFDGMQDGVLVLDCGGRIQRVNRALATMIPDPLSPIGRKPLEVIVSIELQEGCDRVLDPDQPSAPSPCVLELRLWRDRFYTVTISRLPPPGESSAGETEGAIVVFHDITEIKRLEKVRQDFVANVSHELRTPLTSIKGYTETLLSEEKLEPGTLTSFLQVILKNTNHMVRMVDDLLQLAGLEAQQAASVPVSVNAGNALLTAWKACLPLAKPRGIFLQNDLPQGDPWVLGDHDQLVQVFRNLLENAVRYNPPGKPIVVSCSEEQTEVTFRIRDFGPGIPREHVNRIFERFYRIEKHRSSEVGSTGLGLAICRHILRNFGGRIWVGHPIPGEQEGAVFCFTLLRASPGEATW